MAKLTAAQRERLPPSDFACPPLGYPISDPSHVASARSYYKRKYTYKCPQGKKKICTRARKFGMLKEGYPGSKKWRDWCGTR